MIELTRVAWEGLFSCNNAYTTLSTKYAVTPAIKDLVLDSPIHLDPNFVQVFAIVLWTFVIYGFVRSRQVKQRHPDLGRFSLVFGARIKTTQFGSRTR